MTTLWLVALALASPPRVAPPGIPAIPGLMGGDPIIQGQLDKARIHAVIGADLLGLYACRGSEHPPDGSLTVAVELDGQGRITATHLHNSVLGAPKLEDCVVSRVAKLHFDPPTDGKPALFAYPLLFSFDETDSR